MKRVLLSTLIGFICSIAVAQDYRQYFDGADTIFDPNTSPSSIRIEIENSNQNTWQIGKPQKAVFNSSATLPNALVTDTLKPYPINNSSSFQFAIVPWTNWGILAIQWKQKLDMDQGLDGGKIEFSVDAGVTWKNAFNNPRVYNFYGYETANVDTLPNGDFVFSGTDSLWRDIWLCYDMSWLSMNDSILIRFTFTSDSINNNKEGWMIDNVLAHTTIIHTVVSEVKPDKYMNVYPNPSSDLIYIEIQKLKEFHIIEKMILVNSAGQIIDEWSNLPTKFFINAKKYANGHYYLKIKTNIKSETVPVIINH